MIKLYDLEKYLDRQYLAGGDIITVHDFFTDPAGDLELTIYSYSRGNYFDISLETFTNIARGRGGAGLIKNWYCIEYPTDDVGNEINPDLTFNDLIIAMYYREDCYRVLGVSDSLIRERVFEKLADIFVTGYDDIYELWLGDPENKQRLSDYGLKADIC